MNILEFFKASNLNQTFIIGYYGGGNFGDELLLEVILNLVKNNSNEDIKIFYLKENWYYKFHHDFGYELVEGRNIRKILSAIIKSKNIIIGGGGLWGLDFNFNVLLLSIAIFISKFFFLKKIFLIGVGFYNSTTKIGTACGKLVGISADIIIARDKESYDNFSDSTNKKFLDKDIAFYLPTIAKKINNYPGDINRMITNSKKNLFLSLRHFRDDRLTKYNKIVEETIINYKNTFNIILNTLEPMEMNQENYRFMEKLSRKSKINYFDFKYNPIEFYQLMNDNKEKIIAIAPQYHFQLICSLSKIPFFPLVYDDKVQQLHRQFGIKNSVKIEDLNFEDIKEFIRRQ